jgi:hypothetical protein
LAPAQLALAAVDWHRHGEPDRLAAKLGDPFSLCAARSVVRDRAIERVVHLEQYACGPLLAPGIHSLVWRAAEPWIRAFNAVRMSARTIPFL